MLAMLVACWAVAACLWAPGELSKLLLSLSVSSINGDGAETQREYWMREFDDIQHDGLIGFDEFQLHLARSALGVFQLKRPKAFPYAVVTGRKQHGFKRPQNV